MPSPGKTDLTAAIDGAGPSEGRRAADFLHEARERERAACLPEAIVCYQAAVTAAERGGEPTVLAEALRRLAVVQRHRSEAATARDLCQRSYEVARQAGNDLLAAEALNTLGGLHLSAGAPDDARRAFLEALELGGSSRELRARVEQNLGILANIQGELHEAIARYERSLDAYRDCRDEHGCALAYHNLGMVSADRGRLSAADCYFRESRALAERVGDVYLRGLCLVNHAEVDVMRQRFEDARRGPKKPWRCSTSWVRGAPRPMPIASSAWCTARRAAPCSPSRGCAPRSSWRSPRAPCWARPRPRGSWLSCIRRWDGTRKHCGS